MGLGIIINHEIRIPIKQPVFHGKYPSLFFFSWLTCLCLVPESCLRAAQQVALKKTTRLSRNLIIRELLRDNDG